MLEHRVESDAGCPFEVYVGNGMIVHAANPSDGVRVAPVFSIPYSGAVRPG